MGFLFELALALIGGIGAVIAIYEFWIKNTTIPDLPSLAADIKQDDDHVVLAISKKDKDIEGSLSQAIYKYLEEYGPTDHMRHYFIYNPRGFYLSSRSLYIRDITLGLLLTITGLLLLAITSLSPSETNNPNWMPWLIYLISFVLMSLGVAALIYSQKHHKKACIAENYVNFLKKNQISVGLSMLQQKNSFGIELKKL